MNPGAIYSKSGKGVQEASGKTSLLKRAERAVLSAIDGRATLNEVAQKVGKPFDGAFQLLIAQLDRDGFVREVTAAGAAAPASAPAKPAAKPARSKAAAPVPGDDLDFTGVMPIPTAAPAKPAADPATALFKARKEAEERAAEERERLRAEAEAKARAEAEAKAKVEAAQRMREEAAARVRAEAEAKVKAAAEAKARAEAEAKAKIEAERRAREEVERKAREEAERARREAEELRQRLEEERRAREEAERRAKEEAERKAREEAERKAREEAERQAREEAERARREAEELRQRLEEERRAREEAERKAQEEAERARQEAERKARAEQEAQMRRAREEAERKRAEAARKREEAEARKGEPLPEITPPPAPPPQAAPPATAGGDGLDALMADLDSFTQREDQDRKASEEAENRAKEARKSKLQEESEQRARDQAEGERRDAQNRQREEQERREQEHRAREQAEQRARDEAERQRQEAEERARRARETMSARQGQESADDIGVTDDDLDMDDVRRDEAAVAKESRKAHRERERERRRLEKEARERARSAEKAAARQAKAKDKAKGEEAPALKVKVRRPRKWGKPIALTLLLLLVAGIGLLHVVPVPVQDYQQAASEALRQPVRIGEARLSLYKGLQLNLRNVRIGEGTRIAEMRAFPQIGSLASPVKSFERIELDGVTLRQDALDESLFASARGPNFRVERILIKDLKLEGPLPLPPLEADVRIAGDGNVRTVLVRGPEGLMGQLMPKAGTVDFDVTAGSFTVPFAKNLALSSFAMKGRATRQGMRIEAWGGSVLGGAFSGTASLRWGGTWQLDGVFTVRGINAAVFAPALLSEGHAEGTGKFAMSGSDPAALVRSGRVEGNFTIGKGVLGSFDLARAIRTEGREVNGRTPFVELNGLGVYDKGAVALRNVVIGAGALQAGASADISQSGALSGRIVADVRTASQSLRATLLLGGTVKDPQVRN